MPVYRVIGALGILAVLCGLALSACGAAEVAPARDIPITFTLAKPGFVTLVLENEAGVRVANLVQDTWFAAGRHTIYWDGMDIGEPYQRKGYIGAYTIQHLRAAPGTYRLRGLTHQGLSLRYEMSVQSPGTPPWHTNDGSGAWMADHTPPLDALFLPDGSPHGNGPQVLLSASVAEAGHSVIWVTEAGKKLFGGRLYGGRGGLANCRDQGDKGNPAYYAYTLLMGKGAVNLWGLSARGQQAEGDGRQLASFPAKVMTHEMRGQYGLAAYNGTIVVSLPEQGQVAFVSVQGEKPRVVATVPAPDPRGLLFDARGQLYLISKEQVLRYHPDLASGKLGEPQVVVAKGLEDAHRGVCDPQGNLYISDWGASHQVKVFSPDGALLRTIGHPGGRVIGPFDEQCMANPCGLAIDSQGHLWVAEDNYCPKRVSLWTVGGQFVKAFYGPSAYGGGGRLDPRDKTRMYYAQQQNGIEFTLDWQTGASKPRAIYAYGEPTALSGFAPMNAVYLGDRQYMVNNQGRSATMSDSEVGIWLMEKTGVVRRVAALGFTHHNAEKRWEVLNTPEMEAAVKAATGEGFTVSTFYLWTDRNGDAKITPDECQFRLLRQALGALIANEDLSIVSAGTFYLPPPTIDARGVPHYDLDKGRLLGKVPEPANKKATASLGNGDITMSLGEKGWLVDVAGPIRGLRVADGTVLWRYQDQYPNRSEGSPIPRYPGEMVETALILGPPVRPLAGEARELFALNGDMGEIYLMTTDGLFLAALGGDIRVTPRWAMPQGQRGMTIGHVSFGPEMFHPAMTQMADGTIYLVAGHEHVSICSLEGLETVQRLDGGTLTITPEQLAKKPASYLEPPYQREDKAMTVPLRAAAPTVDGKLDEWKPGDFVLLDAALGLQAAAQVSGDKLYLAYRVGDPARLANTGGDGWRHLFASGGGLDLLLRTRPDLPDKGLRTPFYLPNTPIDGDVRVVIARVGDPRTGKVAAVRYQQVGTPAAGEPVLYESPIGQVQFAGVADISAAVTFGQSGGDYEVAIPLATLGLTPADGLVTRADLGVLLGAGGRTQSRIYYGAGHTSQLADVPTEARFDPRWWATWTLKKDQ